MTPTGKFVANLGVGGAGWLTALKVSGAEFAGYATGLWMLTQIFLALRNHYRSQK